MTQVISIINQKGGVGKSTTAFALGTGLHRRGFKVLFIDFDPQANLSHNMKVQNPAVCIMSVLSETNSMEEAIVHSENGDLVPASSKLSLAESSFGADFDREYKLADALAPVRDRYDYILIDNQPTIGLLAYNSLVASDAVILPAHADIYSFDGVGKIDEAIQKIRRRLKTSTLHIDGVLLTRHQKRTNIARDIREMMEPAVREQLETRIYKTTIRECVAIREAQAYQKDIFSYAPNSNAAEDYDAFIREFLGENNG